jgi:acyl carrier protein
VLGVEEFFNIEIPDKDASRMSTPGDVYDFVLSALSDKRSAIVPDQAREIVWNQIVQIIANQLGFKPEQVARIANFVDDLGMS